MSVPMQIQYRDEFVESFEQRTSYLRDTVTTEAVIKGNQARFLVTGVSDSMSERGVDGLIPAANSTDTTATATLAEKHYRATETDFNIFAGQSDRRRILQMKGMKAVNKDIDTTIIEAALTGTVQYNSGSAITLTYGKMVDAISELCEAEVEDDPITCVWTPKAFARILTFSEATSIDYINEKKLVEQTWRPFRFAGALHIMSNRLTGKGTATASNLVFAKSAVGHAIDVRDIRTDVGYQGEHDYSYARHSLNHGAVLLQNSGVIEVVTDDTAAFS
jgi:hypothetical protein